jgi:hypothetical protein
MDDINKKINFLFKKFNGVPNIQQSQPNISTEEQADARMKVFGYQILQQPIPEISPANQGIDLVEDSTFEPANIKGTKYKNDIFPYIVKYVDLELIDAEGGISYFYSYDTTLNKLISNVIPSNFDLAQKSYTIIVRDISGVIINQDDTNDPWVFDGDAGCLYFINSTDGYKFTRAPPSITFWRYEGIIGLDNISGSNYDFLQNNSNSTNLLSIIPTNTGEPENNQINYSNITIDSSNNSIDIPGKITIGQNIELKSLNTIPTTSSGNFPLWINSNDDNNLYLGNKNLEYANNWINTNFLGPPPKILAPKPPISKSTSIFFCWDYPQQIKLSFLPTMVPYINSLYCSYTAVDTYMSPLSGTIINNESNNNYIKYDETVTSQVKGIVLIKQTPSYIGNTLVVSGNIYDIQFPSNYGTIRSYIYYDSNLNKIIENTANNFNIYYSNYNRDVLTNDIKINFNPFLPSYPPSEPSFSQNSVTPTEINININKPQYSDNVNLTETVKLDKYKIIYQLTQNNIRYYDISLADISSNLIVNVDDVVNNNNITQISNLYSDSQYSITAYVKNIYVDQYNTGSPTIFSQTQPLAPTISTIKDISFNIIFREAKKVYNNSLVTNLYLIDGNTKQSLSTKFPIHETANRGKLAGNNPITSISCNIYQSSGVFRQGPSIDLKGFPIIQYTDQSMGNITLQISTPIDSYRDVNKDDVNNKNCGYYLESSATVSLENSAFMASENEYTFSIQRTGLTSNTSSYTYFCEPYPSTPSIGSVTINSITSSPTSYTFVSGIYVFNGIITLDITVNDISGIGQYFYNKTNIVTYNNNNAITNYSIQQETGLYNVINDFSSNQTSINGPITMNNKFIYFLPNTEYYSESLVMNVKAYNILDTASSGTDSAPFPIIIDPRSINLIKTGLKQSINLAYANTTIFNSGFRVWSGVAGNNNLPSSPVLFNDKRYLEYPYDNSWDISSFQELQISNGKFITKSSTFGYKDYRNSYYNTTSKNDKDYSQISATGYRYATFVWNISNPPNNLVYGKLMVQITGTNIVMKKNSSMVYIDNNYTKKILLFYRFEKKTDPNVYVNSYSTNWIDGNSTKERQVSKGNYYLDYPLCGIIGDPYINSGDTTFNLLIPINIMSSNFQDYNLYVRVGTPQEIDFSFENIKVQLA